MTPLPGIGGTVRHGASPLTPRHKNISYQINVFSHSDTVTLLILGKLERPGVNVIQSAEDREKGIDEDEKEETERCNW